MAGLNIVELSDFTGGLNFRADQFQLSSFESPDMLNVEIDPRGGVFSRGGYRRLNTTAVSGTWSPQKLYPFSGATSTLLLANSTKVYKSTGGNFTTLQYSSGNDVVSASPHGVCMAQWGDKMYFATGIAGNGGYVWSTTDTYATALTASGTNPHAWQTTPTSSERKMPTAEHLIVHANKMWAAHVSIAGTHYPNRIHWSLENSPENWDEDDYVDIVGGGNGITGMAVVSGQLVVFKPNAVYTILGYDTATFQVVELTTRLGCLSHHAIAQADNGVYFFSHNQGLYFYNGSGIKDMFDNLRTAIDLNQINPAAHEAISVSWVGRRVWVSVPYSVDSTVTSPTVNFVLDPTIRNGVYTMFSSYDNYGLVGGCDWTDSTDTDYRVMCHPTQAYVLKVDMYSEETDNVAGTDQTFESYYKTRWFDGGSYMQKKMFRRPDFVVKESDLAQAITVKVYHDFTEGDGNERKIFDITQTPTTDSLLWGSGLWGDNWSSGAVSSKVIAGRNLGLARCVQLEFIGPASQKWGINSIGYKYQARRIKG
jgi:hypothetical protein